MDNNTINEIRTGIDEIDRQIITLMARRHRMIKETPGLSFAHELEGMEQMLRQRRSWAYRENLNADIVESIYRQLMVRYSGREMNEK